jgi:indole-3-glycerol phosphate synthase
MEKWGTESRAGSAWSRTADLFTPLRILESAAMTTHLDTILASTRATVVAAKMRVPLAELERKAAEHEPRGWAAALRSRAAEGISVIAEVKKASPSRGLIRAEFDAAELARSYFAGGAAALSVLTDGPFFQGSLRDLELASVAAPLPCLRKDFTVDEYQIAEARAHGADAILLIAAALADDELKRLAAAARGMALDVLVEVHTAGELNRVLDALGEGGADAIGVNNRDLKTLEVRLETALELAGRIPENVVRVAESGIATPEDLARLRAAGFDAFLIGESLMRQADPGRALKDLIAGSMEILDRMGPNVLPEHRAIQEAAPAEVSSKSFNDVLASMPNVGLDADFAPSRIDGRRDSIAGAPWIDE